MGKLNNNILADLRQERKMIQPCLKEKDENNKCVVKCQRWR